ncbi:MAG: dihydropteroate synthase [Candidatus Aminicenantes bacterium]|nr:MAG: dihydropteroate synthase [Candidatus Aminicenantes bacterium]
MGVVNVTPDSFSDPGECLDKDRAVAKGLELEKQGADILDIGGESSRPGSNPISEQEELERVVPVITELRKRAKVLISVDTTKSKVAEEALAAGADIVNDISAFRFDDRMPLLVSESGAPVILMHMKGVPKTMQSNPYYEDLYQEIQCFLEERIATATAYGIQREKIIIDPGIGFGKSLKHNLAIINNLHFLENLNRPILLGISRKSFIGKILNLPPKERTEGTIATAVLSVLKGAHILRVHDVDRIKRAIKVAEAILDEDQTTDVDRRSDKDKENTIRYV